MSMMTHHEEIAAVKAACYRDGINFAEWRKWEDLSMDILRRIGFRDAESVHRAAAPFKIND